MSKMHFARPFQRRIQIFHKMLQSKYMRCSIGIKNLGNRGNCFCFFVNIEILAIFQLKSDFAQNKKLLKMLLICIFPWKIIFFCSIWAKFSKIWWKIFFSPNKAQFKGQDAKLLCDLEHRNFHVRSTKLGGNSHIARFH